MTLLTLSGLWRPQVSLIEKSHALEFQGSFLEELQTPSLFCPLGYCLVGTPDDKWEETIETCVVGYTCEAAVIETVRSCPIQITQSLSLVAFSFLPSESRRLENFCGPLQIKFMRISWIKSKMKSLNWLFLFPSFIKKCLWTSSYEPGAVSRSRNLEINIHGLSLKELIFT